MRLLAATAFAALMLGGPALAATQSPESKQCSADATAKGLHGADREKFMADCKKAAGATAAPAAAAAPAAKPATTAATAAPAAAAKPAAASTATTATAAKSGGFTAKSPEAQACSEQATAKGLHGSDREKFRADCMKGAGTSAMTPAPAPAAAAKPAAAATAAPAAKPAATKATTTATADGAAKPRTANQQAADARIKKCGAMWQADKAAGKTGSQTWPEYWHLCSEKLKAAGQ